jgi:CBS domain-containing protein
MRIKDIMTRDVVTVQPGTSLKDAARMLVQKRISGLPVIDGAGQVIGVLSEADVLMKDGAHRSGGPLSWLLDPVDITRRLRLDAHVVGEAMTRPPITIDANQPAAAAAELMISQGINRLPVVEGGTLVGIVSRADLVRAFARSDAEIVREIRDDVVARSMWLDRRTVQVSVQEGEVALAGTLDRRSEAEVLADLVAKLPGVVDVHSELTWAEDDR